MTLYISDNVHKRDGKASLAWLISSFFCILIDRIYSLFAHGVSSAAMDYMFLLPLLGGTLLFTITFFTHRFAFSRFTFNLWNSGTATVTVAMLLQGVFEIAGTSSRYTTVLYILGCSEMLSAVGISVLSLLLNRHRRSANQ